MLGKATKLGIQYARYRTGSWLLLALAVICSSVILLQPLNRSHDLVNSAKKRTACVNGDCVVNLKSRRRRAEQVLVAMEGYNKHVVEFVHSNEFDAMLQCASGALCQRNKLPQVLPSAWR